MNVLKPHLQTTLSTLLESNTSHRQIERVTGIDRKTIRTYAKRIEAPKANSCGVATGTPDQIPPPRPPDQLKSTDSSCEPHRVFTEAQVDYGEGALTRLAGTALSQAAPVCDDLALLPAQLSPGCVEIRPRDLALLRRCLPLAWCSTASRRG